MTAWPQTLLAHPGTQVSHRLAQQLARCGLLYEFWTGFAVTNGAWPTRILHNCLPLSWQRKIENRILTGVPASRLRTMPFVEWRALRKIGLGKPQQRVFHERNQVFQEQIPTSSLRMASSVIGFDTSSWLLARRVRVLGKPLILDQTHPHPLVNEAMLQQVGSRYPDWRIDIDPRLPEVLASENEEHHLATIIVAASTFTQRTLAMNGIDTGKIVVNPLGVDLQLFYPSPLPRDSGPLRFLFLGSVSARKGVSLLLEAWETLALCEAELWIVGSLAERMRSLIPSLPRLRILGRYPRRELPDLLRQCDVLVFPSYCEGFGLVLLEALATGLPIITTHATAGPDLIQDGVEGRLIPPGNLEALCEAMRSVVRHRDELRKMSVAARRCAERFSWDNYGDRWQRILQGCG